MSLPPEPPRYNQWQPPQNTAKTEPEKGSNALDFFKELSLWKKILLVILPIAALGGAALLLSQSAADKAEEAKAPDLLAVAHENIHPQESWTLKSEVERGPEQPCEDPEGNCPILVKEYTTDTPVTFSEVLALVTGAEFVAGDCTAEKNGEVCATSGVVEGVAYNATVNKADATYTVTVSMSEPKADASETVITTK